MKREDGNLISPSQFSEVGLSWHLQFGSHVKKDSYNKCVNSPTAHNSVRDELTLRASPIAFAPSSPIMFTM